MSKSHARKSASMLIMCEGSSRQDIKVLLLRRSPLSRVWPNALVFPGGLSEEGDRGIAHNFQLQQQAASKINLSVDAINEQQSCFIEWGMENQDTWYSALGTALRETKEECGLDLYTANRDQKAQILGSIAVISHWLTPNVLKKRYDTFIWGMQLDHEYQDLQVDGVEISHAKWWGIAEALDAYQRNDVDLPVPTFMILSELKYLQEQLGTQTSVNKLLQSLMTTPHSQAIQPIIVKDDAVTLYLPGDHEYGLHALQGEEEARIERPFWKSKMQRLRQKKIQLKSESKSIMRWYRVTSS